MHMCWRQADVHVQCSGALVRVAQLAACLHVPRIEATDLCCHCTPFTGLSGFTKRKESEYDCFGAGHSSTSISAALGMSVGKQLTGKSV